MNIQVLWTTGQQEANAVLEQHFREDAAIEFKTAFKDHTKDLLRPEGMYVGATPSDSADAYHDRNLVPPSNAQPPATVTTDIRDGDDVDIITARAANITIEDLLPTVPWPANIDPTANPFLPRY